MSTPGQTSPSGLFGGGGRLQWLYLFGFVRPRTGATAWFTVPGVSTQAMNAVLAEFARVLGANKEHRVLLVLDQAGWYVAKDLALPTGIHLFHLPAYTPELSPAEHLWPSVREELANRFFSHLDEFEEVLAARCRQLSQDLAFIQGATRFRWWPKRW